MTDKALTGVAEKAEKALGKAKGLLAQGKLIQAAEVLYNLNHLLQDLEYKVNRESWDRLHETEHKESSAAA